MDDDKPMRAPARSAAVSSRRLVVGASDELAALPMTTLYPTVSNLQRHGVAVGNFVQDEGDCFDEDPCRNVVPQELNVPNHRHYLQRFQSEVSQITCDLQSVDGPPQELSVPPLRRPTRYQSEVSQVTMPYDLESFDGTEFEHVPPSDDYLDDEELELYLKQLAKEEDQRKEEQRESIKQIVSNERESLQSLLCAMDIPDDDLERLLEEQLEVQQRYSCVGPRRISQCS